MRKELSEKQLRSIERTLSGGTWTITAGAILFSVLTVTPLVQRVTPEGWEWTAPILPIVVDAAVVIVIRMDATISRLGESGGRWPTFLRWLTGIMTLALNTADSALKQDLVGVAVHAVAPLLLIVTAEAALAYRKAIARAQERIARERHEQAERDARERREQAEREQAERREREQREQAEREREQQLREQREQAEREHRLQLEREAREAERERREWEAEQERQREERARRDRLEREERERRDQQEREAREAERIEQQRREEAERQRLEREAKQRREDERRARREQSPAVRRTVRGEAPRPSANTPANTGAEKMPEADARAAIAAGVAQGVGVRELSRRTGWSLAWVSERHREARGEHLREAGREHPAMADEPFAEAVA